MTFNNLEITVRDTEAMMARLFSARRCVNAEVNNGYFSGATYPGNGYNIHHHTVANMRYYNIISTSSSATFSSCGFENAGFDAPTGSLVNFRHCTFSGDNTGLDTESIGKASGNILKREANVSFPVEHMNREIYTTDTDQ